MTLGQQLLAATPLPPSKAGADDLLAAFHAMLAARDTVLAGVSAGATATADERAELQRRHEVWIAALAAAQREVAGHRIGVSRLRAYARP